MFVSKLSFDENIDNYIKTRLASLVGITEREIEVGKLGWHGNSTRDLTEQIYIFSLCCVTKEEKKD